MIRRTISSTRNFSSSMCFCDRLGCIQMLTPRGLFVEICHPQCCFFIHARLWYSHPHGRIQMWSSCGWIVELFRLPRCSSSMCVCALCQRESGRKARLRTSQTIFRAWERERERSKGGSWGAGFVEECCSSSAASCENGGDNVKLTECFFSL